MFLFGQFEQVFYWVVALGVLAFLAFVAIGILRNSNNEHRLRKIRSDKLRTSLDLLQKGMSCMRENLPAGKGALVFTHHTYGGIILRHEVEPQNDVIRLTIAGEKLMEISIRDDKIEDHLPVTKKEHQMARDLLALLRVEEAKIAAQ